MISETKLDNSFREGEVFCRGRSIVLYVREHIPSKLLSIENQPVEGFYIEINLRGGGDRCFVVHIINTGIILATTLILLAKTLPYIHQDMIVILLLEIVI